MAMWTIIAGVCAVIGVVIGILQLARPGEPERGTGQPPAVITPESSPSAGVPSTAVVESPTATLDLALEPSYYSEEGAAGFAGDPLSFALTSGGSIDVSYVSPGCVGFAAPAPDFRFQWDGNGGLLRFYFVGDGDAALVVNAPDNSWHCNDDSYGGSNPTVDFATGPDGRYDIWVASYSADTFITGTLFVTELDSQFPAS